MTDQKALQVSLLSIRITVFLVLLVWTIDKFVNPAHAAAVYENFYFIDGLGKEIMFAIGAIELAIIFAFVAGLWKTWTYGAVLIFHGVSTLSSYEKYLAPFDGPNLLFFAAIPMLAACLALYLLRDRDRLLSL